MRAQDESATLPSRLVWAAFGAALAGAVPLAMAVHSRRGFQQSGRRAKPARPQQPAPPEPAAGPAPPPRVEAGSPAPRGRAPRPGLRRMAFVSVFVDDRAGRSEANGTLLQSPVYARRAERGDVWKLVANPRRGQPGARVVPAAYAEAAAQLPPGLPVLYVHPDVYLPESFEEQMEQALRELDATDPKWGVVGFVGIGAGPEAAGRKLKWYARAPPIAGRGRDFMTQFHMPGGARLVPAQGLDESAVLVAPAANVSWDPGPPGDDMFGMDIVIQAERSGRTAYVAGVDFLHKMRPGANLTAEESGQLVSAWWLGVTTPEARERFRRACAYYRDKWCPGGYRGSGVVRGTFVQLNCHLGGQCWCPKYACSPAAFFGGKRKFRKRR